MNASLHTHKLPRELAGYAGRRHSNLALALILLPGERQSDAFLFYDFCRAVDDIADSGTATPHQRQALLDLWIEALQPNSEKNLPADFFAMIQRRQLDRGLLTEIILGMRMDIAPESACISYRTFKELHHYCWRVASAVGLISATLFGANGASVEHYAKELGIALQLTNILRDIAEDAALNRIYLPLEDLERFGVGQQQILSGTPSPEMTHLLHYQAERADAYFARAELAWSEMSINQRRLMRPARLMSAIYRNLLLQMHRERYDVFQKKYRVRGFMKLILMVRILTGKN